MGSENMPSDAEDRTPNSDADKRGHEALKTGGPSLLALSLLGAIGFGVAFSTMCAIDMTSVDMIKNTFADIFPGTAVGPEVGFTRGVIVGAIGGAALGLGFKRRKHILWLALAGALGFGIGFAYPTLLASIADILAYEYLWAGVLIGAVGGTSLGVAATRGSILRTILVGAAGAVSFACAFAVRGAVYNQDLCSSWNGLAGAIGGAGLGLALAACTRGSARAN